MSSASGSASGSGNRKWPAQAGKKPDGAPSKPKFDGSFIRGKLRHHIRLQQNQKGNTNRTGKSVIEKLKDDDDDKTEFETTKAGFHPAVSKHGLRTREKSIIRSPNSSTSSSISAPSKEPLEKAAPKPRKDDDDKTEFERVKGVNKPAISKGLREKRQRLKANSENKTKEFTEKSIAEDEAEKTVEGTAGRRKPKVTRETRVSDRTTELPKKPAVKDTVAKRPSKREERTKEETSAVVGVKPKQKPKIVTAVKARKSDREAEKTQRSIRSEVQPAATENAASQALECSSSRSAVSVTSATSLTATTDCPSMLYSPSENGNSSGPQSEEQTKETAPDEEQPQVGVDDSAGLGDPASVQYSDVDGRSEEMAVSKPACAALESMHKRTLFSNILSDIENETLRRYFDGEAAYTEKLLLLLDKAMEKLIDRLRPLEDDGEIMGFLSQRSSAKNLLVDALLARPAYLPPCWGGRTLDGIIPKDSLLLPSARKPVTGEDDESSTRAADPFSGSTRTDSAAGSSSPSNLTSSSSVSPSTNSANTNSSESPQQVTKPTGMLEEHSFAALPPSYQRR